MSRKPFAVLLLASFLLAACGRGDDPALAPSPADSPEATPALSPEPLEGASCEQQTGGNRDAAMFLTDVQVIARDGYDRVVFEFEPQEGQSADVPFFQIEPTEPPLREDGSGNEIEVEGSAFLQAIIWATGVEIGPEEPRAVYTGPKSHRPTDTNVIEEVREAGDFENTMTWYVGMTHAACFKVDASTAGRVQLTLDIDASGEM